MPPLLVAAVLSLAPLAAPQEDPRIALRTTPEVKVAREVQPAVVYIEWTGKVQVLSLPFGRPSIREQTRTGSGVIVDERGYIITNCHVVQGMAQGGHLTVQFDQSIDPKNDDLETSRKWEARLLSASAEHDLALIKVDTNLPLKTVRMAPTSSDLMVGERVIAIGNPYGQRLTVSSGIISGLHRKLQVDAGFGTLALDDLIQTDAAINQGNSGGPLLNILGEMIGINTAVNQGAENMGFAIPIDRIQEVLRDQLLSADASRVWLGFDVDDAGTLCINKIVKGSPADLAGMEVGYRLIAINDTEVYTAEDFRLQRASLRPNQSVGIRVAMPEGSRKFELRGWQRFEGVLYERMGLKLEPGALGGNHSQFQTCLAVGEVQENGPAAELGLAPGDFIDSIRLQKQGRPGPIYQFGDPFELAQFVAALSPGEALDLDVLRDENRDDRLDLSNELFKGTLVLR
jgi:serine protease Do